ncbi:hypothetical protein KIW84_043511 [Lathyrus oleraceus]|uniref:Uncharacterized protein n=1 Tax=Pisum sativum TaxID=3888 RepID=A0A9D4XIJ4_PEA|nr:hypothetical protein KIW84_043511 [Pisum sativum]
MARSRRAILLDIKWACLESLLSIPSHALKNGIHLEENYTFFSDDTLRCIFGDLVKSLENAGGSSVLSMLRSLRMLFELVAKVTPSAVVSCSHVIDAQVYLEFDLACMVESPNEDVDCMAALDSGRSFLLELLDSAVNDKDLAKELYKKI